MTVVISAYRSNSFANSRTPEITKLWETSLTPMGQAASKVYLIHHPTPLDQRQEDENLLANSQNEQNDGQTSGDVISSGINPRTCKAAQDKENNFTTLPSE